MGLLSQAPIGSLPARPARAWVNAARPVDRSMPGHEVVRSRGQIRPDSATIMLTVVAVRAPTHAARLGGQVKTDI